MTERIKYNTILKGKYYEGEIYLLINPKVTMIVKENVSLIRNTPHSTSLVFYETNVRYYQYRTEATT